MPGCAQPKLFNPGQMTISDHPIDPQLLETMIGLDKYNEKEKIWRPGSATLDLFDPAMYMPPDKGEDH